MDSTIAASAVTEQVAMCIQLGLLCTQGDPDLRPNMHRVVVVLSKKPKQLEEPTRPGVLSSRYRRHHHMPFTMSSTVGSSDSGSHTSASSNHHYSSSANATTITSNSRELDPHGKRPMQG